MTRTQQPARPVTLWHIPMPTQKRQGTTPQEHDPEPDEQLRRVICGNRYRRERTIDRHDFLMVKLIIKHEIQGTEDAEAQEDPRKLCMICRAGLKKMLRPIFNPPATKRPWTEEEKDTVRLGYEHNRTSVQRLAQRLDRTEISIKGMVQQLNITRSYGRKRWTRADDQRLIDLAGTMSMQRIAHIMGRSTNSVVVRSKRLGINRRDHEGWYTARDVARILGVDDHWVRTRILSGVMPAVRYTATTDEAKLDQHDEQFSGNTWRIEEKNLVAFIRKYAHELTGRNVDLLQIVEMLAGLTDEEKQKGRPPIPRKSRKAPQPASRGRKKKEDAAA